MPKNDPIFTSKALTHIIECKWKFYASAFFIREALWFMLFTLIMVAYGVYFLPLRLKNDKFAIFVTKWLH